MPHLVPANLGLELSLLADRGVPRIACRGRRPIFRLQRLQFQKPDSIPDALQLRKEAAGKKLAEHFDFLLDGDDPLFKRAATLGPKLADV
jgi:hypothetical protein